MISIKSPVRVFILGLLVILTMSFTGCREKEPGLPNFLIIYADDLGYGDVGCYNPESKIPTPNIDILAINGMRFTDGHAPSTACTPSRYSLLTGRMEFRTGFRSVFTGTGGPNLIEEGRLTLPGMLKQKGYSTAMFGKWHVGLNFQDSLGQQIEARGIEGVNMIDYSRKIPDAPIHRGFDIFWGTACCPTTDWLYAFIDGDSIPVRPTQLVDKSTLPDHEYSTDCRPGMIAPGFEMEEVDMQFLDKSLAFLKNHAEESPDKPFFLYHATQAVHLPSFPGRDFKGKTNTDAHGDFIFELDWIVGRLVEALEENGFADNTLIIFSSDNGPEVIPVYHMRRKFGHIGARPWRGMKRDHWEGGHRVPFIVKWPGKIQPGSTSDQMISQTDVMATIAAITGIEIPENAAEDSYNFLPVLLGEQGEEPVRDYMLQQTIRLDLGIRKGKWKYLDHKGSGGNNYEAWDGMLLDYILEDTDPDAPGQLYDLEADPGETTNLYTQYPEIVDDLKSQLDEWIESGRSAPLGDEY